MYLKCFVLIQLYYRRLQIVTYMCQCKCYMYRSQATLKKHDLMLPATYLIQLSSYIVSQVSQVFVLLCQHCKKPLNYVLANQLYSGMSTVIKSLYQGPYKCCSKSHMQSCTDGAKMQNIQLPISYSSYHSSCHDWSVKTIANVVSQLVITVTIIICTVQLR